MSHVGVILGISDLEVQRVDRHRSIEVYAKPTRRQACIHCGYDRLRIKETCQRRVKHTKQGPRVLFLNLSVPKYHCPKCNRYFRHRFRVIRPRFRASELFKLEVFEAHDGGVSQRKLSRTHGLACATVERWYQAQIKQRRSEMSNRPCPRVLGIDEHFFTKKKGYATTFVDLKNRKVFDVKLGRSEPSLRSFLRRLPGKENTQIVVMDLSETYRSIARRYFPNATIVADRFHVVRLVNEHFLRAWQKQDPEGRKNRGLLSLMRRHRWNLTNDQRSNLGQYLKDYPVLKALYDVKHQLMQLLILKGIQREAARYRLKYFLELLDQLDASPLHRLSKTLRSWMQPIVAMWRFTRSNGITEGFHTKMEMMTRRAYGFRNFENYRTRVLTHCGWNGVYNRT